MADPQILMPQAVSPMAGPQPVSVTLGRQMRRAEGIMAVGAVVGAYGFVEGSKPARWIGLGALAWGALCWWRGYKQNQQVVASQAQGLLAAAQPSSAAGAASVPPPGMAEPPEPPGMLPGRPLRSVPRA